jgi:hypothetical protein
MFFERQVIPKPGCLPLRRKIRFSSRNDLPASAHRLVDVHERIEERRAISNQGLSLLGLGGKC